MRAVQRQVTLETAQTMQTTQKLDRSVLGASKGHEFVEWSHATATKYPVAAMPRRIAVE